MKELPEGYSTRTLTLEDADEVAALISACIFLDGGEASTTAEEVLND